MKKDKKYIDKLIYHERQNNFWNHIITIFSFKREIFADKKENQYILWSLSPWVGAFYLVYEISFDKDNNISEVSTELNIVAKVFRIAVILLWLFLLRFVTLNFIDIISINSVLVIIIFFVFTAISYILSIKIYRLEREDMLKCLKILDD